MASIGDLFLRLLVDGGTFEVDVEKKAAAAGDQAGKTMGQRIGANLAPALSRVIGGALALATAHGLRLNQVLHDLQAETGAVGADWEAMSETVRRQNGRTTESIEDIAAAVKGMRQDLGLTGEEFDLYSDRIFDAGLATRKGAAFIVAAADDIGDAWGLSLTESLDLIDALIVSQQKWGGSIEDRLKLISDLAPALKALNQTEADGVELLNAAAASGLDAVDLMAAMKAAAVRLKVPFDTWIAQIGAIADDSERLAAATAGVGPRAALVWSTVARALFEADAAGTAFTITQEEAADAATEMADKIDSGPIRSLQLLGEKVGALLADAGSNPLVTGIASFGTILAGFAPGIVGKFGGALVNGMKGIGSRILTLVAGEIVMSSTIATLAGSRVGAMTGAAFGRAMALAIPAGMVAVAVAIGLALAVLIDKLFPGLAKSMADNFKKGVDAVIGFVGDMAEAIGRAFDRVSGFIGDLVANFQRGADLIVQALQPIIGTLRTISDWLGSLGPKLHEVITGQGSASGSAVGGLIRSTSPTAVTAPAFRNTPTQGLFPNDWFIPQVSPPGFEDGAYRTTAGLGMIHDDEMILSKGPADALRDMLESGGLGGDTFNVNFHNAQLARGVTGPDVARTVRHIQSYGRRIPRARSWGGAG